MGAVDLDIRTLLLATALLAAFNAVVVLSFRVTQESAPGFSCWAASVVTGAVAFALLGLRDAIPDELSIVGADTLLALAAVLRLDGSRRFLRGVPVPRPWYLLVLATCVAMAAFFYPPYDSAVARLVVVSAAVAIPVALIGVEFLRSRPPRGSRLHLWAFGLAMLLLVGLVARVVSGFRQPGFTTLRGGTTHVAFFLLLILVEAGATLILLLLNAQRIEQRLREALSHVKVLGSLLPMCAACRKIRDDDGYWQQLEAYVEAHSDTHFSHGLCPDCMKRLYPGFDHDRHEGPA